MVLPHLTMAWVLIFRMQLVSSSCLKYAFLRTDFMKYTVGGVYGPTPEPISVDRCAKICRLLSQCLGFNMQWTDKEQGYGYCQAFGPVSSGNGQENDDNFSFYAVCPDTMTYYPTSGHCYSLIRLRRSWDAAKAYCHDLYPGAHLMEIQSSTEQLIASSLSAGVKKVWLGGRRTTDGGRYEFNWVQRNRNIYYDFTNWHRKEPSAINPSKPSDCISMKNALFWYDNTCTKAYYFLCEY